MVASVLPRNSQNYGWLRYSPTEFTEFTEVLGCCWLRGYGRMPYPPNLCASVPICGRYFSAKRFCAFRGFCGNIVSHGFHRSTQMVGCVNSPTEFTEFTEVLGVLLAAWVRQDVILHRSTQMVGCVNSPTEFTEFTEVLGCCWQRGYGRMPYPPNLCASVLSVGDSSLQETSVRSVGSVGIQSPTDFTD